MWPEKNTAFVVIHGAGSHRPFEALDKFVRGYTDVLKQSNPDLDRWWRHRLQRHDGWIEHFISLAPDGKPVLDFYEYYWDCYMDHQVELSEVADWLRQVSQSARRFYRERPDLSSKHEGSGSKLFKDGDFQVGGYFIHLGWAARFLRFLQRLGVARIPVLSTLTTWLLSRAASFASEMMGDVVIYTTADVRSQNYAIRQKLLGGAVEELKLLIQRDDYHQIIVVGHSLGTVIAYDALNRLVLEMNAAGGVSREQVQKLVGLVTFGSPLDKVAFFFREHTAPDEHIRRQILAHYHGFRRRPFPGEENLVQISNPVQQRIEATRWLNFYHLQDPVSGHLDAYDVDANILCTEKAAGSAAAHSVYWTYAPMYEAISAEFFGPAPHDFRAA